MVLINRFPEEERSQLAQKFRDIIESLTAADKADENYVHVLNHLYELAAEEELVNFEPLTDDPKKALKELLKTKALKPVEMFKDISPPTKTIGTYKAEVENRVRYHL